MKRGHIGFILLGLAVAAGVGYGFLPRPVAVDIIEIATGDLAVTIEEEGRTRVRERYVVSAPVTGLARRIELKPGDPVRARQVVARIDPARSSALDPRTRAELSARGLAAEAALAAARENVRAALAEDRLAQQELDRVLTLHKDRFVAQAAVDQAHARRQASLAAHEAAEQSARVAAHELAAARAALAPAAALSANDAIAVASPVEGRVLSVQHESEGLVTAGQPLLEVGNPGSLEVLVELLSTSAVRLMPGSHVRLDRWGGEPGLDAVVRVVEPTGFTKVSALGVEEQRVRVLCDIVTPRERWRQLGDGYRVEASFVLWEGRDILLAPVNALFRHGEGWAVFAVENGRAKTKPVRIGQRNGLSAQVLEGLRAGDRVIARPDDRIADGVRVAPR